VGLQVLVVGAGVIGLAVARAAALAGHEVIVAEAADGIGTGISSRNSEVIHAGLYYPTGSLRALHCVRGRRMLYDYCASHGIPHNKCGKLLVATNDQEIEKVEQIRRQGETNGVEGLEMIGGNTARALEPEVWCIAALMSPSKALRCVADTAGGVVTVPRSLMVELDGTAQLAARAFNTQSASVGEWLFSFSATTNDVAVALRFED
jgi:L-2-hydroxyglutarate oxidase LhgO